MGSSPMVRPGQAATSIFVQLGNGDNFVFDIGEGSIANYVAGRFALNELKHNAEFRIIPSWMLGCA